MDREARFRTERLAVEDQVGALAVNGHLVHFLKMDPAHLLALVTASQSRSEDAKDGPGLFLDRENLEGTTTFSSHRIRQQHLVKSGYGEKRKASRDRLPPGHDEIRRGRRRGKEARFE